MRISLLSSQPHDLTLRWVADGFHRLGHDVETTTRPGLPLTDAGPLGHRVRDGWGTAPDVVVALGVEAGLAGMVATRGTAVPMLARIDRPGRSGDPATTRVEAALARGATGVLCASPHELADLVRHGVPRSALHLLPEAVDVASLRPDEVSAGGDDPEPVAAADDTPESVHRVLRGMAAGRPAVVVAEGGLPDLVADAVCGLVVPSTADVDRAVRALSGDGVRRAAMGMAAADRVVACFDTAVVVPALGRLLDKMVPEAQAAA